MIACKVNRTRARALQLLAIGLAGSQAGHLVTYQFRFGDAAIHLERAGAHAYFLPAATWLAGAIAAAGLAALLLIAWGRLVAGRRLGLRRVAGWPVLDVLPLLFVLQLTVYAGQESIEALAAGTQQPAVLDLLLWGALGQLPVAGAAAVALAWISTRLEGAFEAVDIRLARLLPDLVAPRSLLLTPRPVRPSSPLPHCAPAALVKRGPPGRS